MKISKKDSDRIFSQYYTEVGRTEQLDPKTERECYMRYVDKDDLEARDRLLGNCLRYVVKLANQYANDADSLKDLISAGNYGLMLALDRYDPNRNTRFISYATYWILLGIRNELQGTQLVAIPSWRKKAIRKVRSAEAKIIAMNGHASPEDVCSEADISLAQLDRLQIRRFYYTSLSRSHNRPDALTPAIERQLSVVLTDVLRKLTTIEHHVVRAYFGFTRDPQSLREISAQLGITSERVRQYKTRAIKKIRRALFRRMRTEQDNDEDSEIKKISRALCHQMGLEQDDDKDSDWFYQRLSAAS